MQSEHDVLVDTTLMFAANDNKRYHFLTIEDTGSYSHEFDDLVDCAAMVQTCQQAGFKWRLTDRTTGETTHG